MLEAAVAALDQGVTVHAADGAVLVANARAREVLGDAAPPYAGRVAEVLAAGRPLRDEVLEHRRPGERTRRWLRATLTPLAGPPAGVLASFADVTEQHALRSLRELGRQLRALFGDDALEVFVKDLEGRLLFASHGFAAAVGRPGEDLRGRREEDIASAERLEICRRVEGEALWRGEPVLTRERLGEQEYAVFRVPVLDDQDEAFAIAGVSVDVTGLSEPPDALVDALRTQLDALDQGILLVGRDLAVRHHNAGATRLLAGADLEPVQVVDTGDEPGPTGPLSRLVAAALAEGSDRRDALARVDTPHGDVRWLSVDVHTAGGDDAVVCLRDVTGEQARQDALEAAAYRDPLTGLGNRRLFDESLALAIERVRRAGRRLAVAVLDVDGLKAINDAGGHVAGDRALAAVGAALRAELRGADLTARGRAAVVPTRYAGDEFLLLFAEPGEEASPAAAAAAALGRVLRALEADPHAPSVSWGIAEFPADGADAEALVAAADRRMYEHKRRRDRSGGAGAPHGA